MDLSLTPIAVWLLRASLGGTVLIVMTLVALRCIRQPARRQRLGELGLAAALVLAATCWTPAWLPLWAPPPAPLPQDVYLLIPGDGLADAPVAAVPAPIDGPGAPPAEVGVAAPGPIDLSAWLLPALIGGYGLGVAWFVLRWFAGVVALRRIVRAARPAAPELLQTLAQHQRGKLRPRVLISHQLRVPISCGIFRPTIILPAALAAPERTAQREWVFAHELTHLLRRDAWSAFLFALGQVIYFVLPWFWWLRRQVRLCQEYVADAAAIRRCRADDYAEFLLSLTASPAAPLAATGVSGHKSDLYRRVAMILQNPVPVETSCPRRWTMIAAAALLGAAVLVSGVGPAQADPPNQKEVLEQLERIQDMVNKLRRSLAEPDKDTVRKPDQPGRVVVDLDGGGLDVIIKKKADLEKRDPKQVLESSTQRAVIVLQKALAGVADKQRDQAREQYERALAQAKDALKGIAAQKDADRKQAEEALARARAQLEMLLAQQQFQQAVGQGGGADADLKSVLELLEKHHAKLKEGDPGKELLQDAMNRLKSAIKQQSGLNQRTPYPVPRNVPAPPATPAVPAKPVPPKPGTVVAVPNANVYGWPPQFWTTKDKPVRLWDVAAAPQGRLGIRVEAPSPLLVEQLNLSKDQGLVITEVFENSVAGKAGVKVNDILLKINQKPVTSNAEDLVKTVQEIKADSPFDIVVLRRGKQETIQNVRLPEQPVRTHSAIRMLLDPKSVQVTITASRTGNALTLYRNEGETAITVQAEVADGKTKVTSIGILEKGKTSKYAKVDEVPEPHRAKVQHLIQLLDSLGNPAATPKTGELRLFFPNTGSDGHRYQYILPVEKGIVDVPVQPQPNPPARKVQGTIARIHDQDSAIVELTIGKDAGLSKNHTLEAYRLDPPTYLGLIRVVEVAPNNAVGRLERVGPKATLRVGDSVTGTITSK